MADGYISQITLPNNSAYNIKAKSLSARTASNVLVGSGTAASYTNSTYYPAKWTFNTGAEPNDGDIITIKIPVAGHDYGVFLSTDNGTTYHPIVCNGTARLTTHYPINTYLTLIFESTGSAASMFALAGQTSSTRITVTGGVWRVINYYDSNSNDTGYYHRRIYPNLKAGGAIHPYSIIMQLPNGRWSGITTTPPNNPVSGTISPVATGKEASTSGYLLGHILVMYARATYADGNNIATYNIWSAHSGLIDGRYSFNLANSTGNGFVGYTPIYIVGTISDGLFYLDTDKWWTQALPTSDDGKAYIYIGDAYDWYRLTFTEDKPIYWYKNGAVRLYSDVSEYALKAPLSGLSDADDLKAIEALSGTSGFLKKTAENTWTLDTSEYLKLDGSNNMTADVNIIAGDTDKLINFWYNTNKTAGASWRIGMLGSGSNDTNYFVIESGTSTTSATTWNRAVQIGQNTYDITIKGDLIPAATDTKTLGTSSYKWSNVYATTFTGNLTGNADSATQLANAREIYVDLATTRNTSSKVTFDGTTDISIHVSGTLPVARGGTGLTTSTTVNAVVIGNSTTATNTLQTVATASGAFYATDTNAKPQFGKLPIAQGGTNATSFTNGCVIVPSTTSNIQSLGSTGLKVEGATNGNITLSPYTAGKTMTISSSTGAMTISTTTAAMSLSTTSGTLSLTTSSGNMSLSSGGTVNISSANAKAMTISSGHNLALSNGNSQDITITSAKDIIYTAANNSSHIFKMNTTEYGRFNASGMFQLNETGEQSSHKLYVNGNSAFNGKIAFGEESDDSITEKAYMIYNDTDESIDFIFT